jgi:hypothetical protein
MAPMAPMAPMALMASDVAPERRRVRSSMVLSPLSTGDASSKRRRQNAPYGSLATGE